MAGCFMEVLVRGEERVTASDGSVGDEGIDCADLRLVPSPSPRAREVRHETLPGPIEGVG